MRVPRRLRPARKRGKQTRSSWADRTPANAIFLLVSVGQRVRIRVPFRGYGQPEYHCHVLPQDLGNGNHRGALELAAFFLTVALLTRLYRRERRSPKGSGGPHGVRRGASIFFADSNWPLVLWSAAAGRP
jgi:hypothetical protein